jgi:hypothetical protein
LGYTLWFDEIKFEKLGTVGKPTSSILNGQSSSVKAFIGSTINITGLSHVYNLVNGQDVSVISTSAYYKFTSSNPTVATINDNGVVKAPTLKSTVVSDPSGSYINLNIGNNSYIDNGGSQSGGDINIKSVAGYVSINDFIFPKASDINSSKDGYVLKFKWIGGGGGAYGVWESAFSQSITTINNPSGPVTITGNPVILNGYNFTENTPVPTAVGGIQVGDTFANVNVLDMIRRIVYTYIPPTITHIS